MTAENQMPALLAGAHVDTAKYEEMYAASIADPEAFWAEQGQRVDWIKPFSKVKDTSYAHEDVHIRWYEDGTLNVAANCIDRHIATRGDQTAILFEPDEPTDPVQEISYRELGDHVGRFANVLKGLGVGKGDRVIIYLPMIPEAAYAMLACARIGAIHSIVFAGFSPDALAARVNGCDAKLVITSDGAPRGGRVTGLKDNVNKALLHAADSVQCLVVKRTGQEVAWVEGRDHWYEPLAEAASPDCPPEEMNAEDPLFILYTSGSTGQPKGVVHSTGGYLVYASLTPSDHVRLPGGRYLLVHGGCGLGHGPQLHRLWPAGQWRDHADVRGRADLSGCRPLLGGLRKAQGQPVLHRAHRHPRADGQGDRAGREIRSVEPEAAGHRGRADQPGGLELVQRPMVGKGRCPIVDTWWQTETGGHMMTPLPGAHPELKPGSAQRPFFRRETAGAGSDLGRGDRGRRRRGRPGHRRQLARARCARSGATMSAS